MVENGGRAPADANLGISGAASVFVAWFCAGLCNQISVARSLPETTSIETRIFALIYDAGYMLALGLVTAGLCGLFRRWGNGRNVTAVIALTIGALILAALLITPDLSNMSVRVAGARGAAATTAVLVFSVIGFGLTVPVAFLVGRFMARPRWRWFGIGASVLGFTAHPLILPNSYHGIHFVIVLAAATFFGACLAGASLPPELSKRFSRQPHPSVRTMALAFVAALAAFSIGRRPPSRVAAELVRLDGSLLPHFLLRLLHAPKPLRDEPIPAEMQEWFVDRENHAPVAPSTPPIFSDKPVVILITIDCVRADVIMSGKFDSQLRTFANLRNSSVTFSNTRSTAPGTISSLATIFTGTHFSEQYWVPVTTKGIPFPDDHRRINEYLNDAGVKTVTFTGAPGLLPEFGLMRGFSETTNLQTNRIYATAETLMNASFRRLLRAGDEKLFLHLHFLEAHEPYDLGIQTGSQFDRYISELQIVDRQLDRLISFIRAHELRNRTLLIVTADHGEAFGEHGMVHHSATVYDELLQVPLLVWRAQQNGSIMDEPVSLIDLGPTILDTLGVPTPGYFMGQSLVPYLRGEKPKLTRPILAEARLKQTLVLREGLKVILDNRFHTVELYDLNTDPQELNSLADDEERLSRPLSLLQQFFAVHHNRTPGYTPPYRVW